MSISICDSLLLENPHIAAYLCVDHITHWNLTENTYYKKKMQVTTLQVPFTIRLEQSETGQNTDLLCSSVLYVSHLTLLVQFVALFDAKGCPR